MRWKQFLVVHALAFALGFALMVLVNVAVDPDGLIGWVDAPGWNREKTRLASGETRLRKARLLETGRYDALLLGTSRVQLSLDPRHRALVGHRAFNLGLEGANMLEIVEVAGWARERQDLRLTVIGLDFFSFSKRRGLHEKFRRSLFSEERAGWSDRSYLLSMNTFFRALGTVWDNWKGAKPRRSGPGFVRMGDRWKMDHRIAFTRILEESYLIEEQSYAGFVYGADRVSALEGLVRSLAASGMRVKVFFSPVHARQLEAIRALGLLPLWERWREDVAAAIARVPASSGPGHAARVELWDFAGYTAIHTEPIPAKRSGERMRWWLESAHFQQGTGDAILSRIFGLATPPPVPRDFGVRIAGSDLTDRHEQLRGAREVWAKRAPSEVADVAALVTATEPIRARIPAWQADR